MAILVKSSTDSGEKDRWATQHGCFNDGQHLYGRPFKIDVAAEPETAKCDRFMVSPDWFEWSRLDTLSPYAQSGFNLRAEQRIVGFDSLHCDWENDWWCNPPFTLKKQFLIQAAQQVAKGFSGMMLLPYEPLSGWWLEFVKPFATVIYEPDGRYNFYQADGVTKKHGVNFGSALVLFTPHAVMEPARVGFSRGVGNNVPTPKSDAPKSKVKAPKRKKDAPKSKEKAPKHKKDAPKSKIRVLNLPVKALYFNEIKAGTKIDEYRLQTQYWEKRLVDREFDEIHIKLGYPKADEHERILIRPWQGVVKSTIQHNHFGTESVDVFAIRVN